MYTYTTSEYAKAEQKTNDFALNNSYFHWYLIDAQLESGSTTHYHGFSSTNFDQDDDSLSEDDKNIILSQLGINSQLNVIAINSYEHYGFMTLEQMQSVIDFEKLNDKYPQFED